MNKSPQKKIRHRCDDHHDHPDHGREFKRIHRIQGQLDGIKRMIEERRYCPDILMQTRAIAAAVRSLESAILERHLRHCVSSVMQTNKTKDVDAKINELVELFQKQK